MRNRSRHEKAGGALQAMTSEDVPGLFRFCGFGLLFSDATGEDSKELNLTIAPNQLKQIQDILIKETDGKGSVELITLNKQKANDEIIS